MGASGTRLSLGCGKSVRFKVGERQPGVAANPPVGFGPKPILADRVENSLGSFNAGWRREFPGGNTEEPREDIARVSAENAEREKLNDERGKKSLSVNRRRDEAEREN